MYTGLNRKRLVDVLAPITVLPANAWFMEQEVDKKGRWIMFEKNILILIMSMLLLGAAMISIPIPVLWGMGCLVFLALFIVERRAHQG
jgi:hypothetical protein